MKSDTLSRSLASLGLVAVALFCLLAPASASAQTRTINGHFKGDGTVGKYTRTVTIALDGSRTILTTYTRTGDKATRTDSVTQTAEDSKGGYTVDTSLLDFGATVADTTHEVVTRVKAGRHTSVGTYTTATGDSGTLTSVASATDSGTATSEVRVSPTTGTTQILRVERDADDFLSLQTMTLKPDGTATIVNWIRYNGSADNGSGSTSPTPTPTPTVTPTATP